MVDEAHNSRRSQQALGLAQSVRSAKVLFAGRIPQQHLASPPVTSSQSPQGIEDNRDVNGFLEQSALNGG